MDDHQLLQRFISDRSQDAFRQLMERHLPMVYSAACRMVSDSGLAQDVAQKVFLTFAEKAASVLPPQVVGGWLYNTTRNVAMHTVRAEQRRREREQMAAMQMIEVNDDSVRILEQLEPAMAELDPADRDALVLRYFESRSLRELGSELGISEDAARMRVNRAESRLKEIFNRRGVAVSSVVLASALAASTTTAVPAALSTAIIGAVFSGIAITTTAVTTMNWINIKSIGAIITAAFLAGTGTFFIQQNGANELRRDREALRGENRNLQEQIEAAQAAAREANGEIESLRQNSGELLRLRNEIGQLRQQLNAAKAAEARARSQKTAAVSTAPKANHFSRERLVFVGYDTPEAALQTAAWAAIQGGESQMVETLSPELLADRSALSIYRENQKQIGPVLQGITMLARKPVSDTEVQIKVEYEVGMGGQTQKMYAVTPMLKGADGWKLGITRDYSDDWENSGTIEALGGN